MSKEAAPVAVVSGAASGIGLELSAQLAQGGYAVVMADVRADILEAAVRHIRDVTHIPDVTGEVTDVASAESVEDLAISIDDMFGRTADLLINSAGVLGPVAPTWESDLSAWELTFRVNYWGVVHAMRSFLPRMIAAGGGRVVNVASAASWYANPNQAAYDSTKHAVMALTESAFRELAERRSPVRVSLVCPTAVRTPLFADLADRKDAASQRLRRSFDAGLPADEVATMIIDGILNDNYLITTDRERLVRSATLRLDIAGGAAPVLDGHAPQRADEPAGQ